MVRRGCGFACYATDRTDVAVGAGVIAPFMVGLQGDLGRLRHVVALVAAVEIKGVIR